MGVCISKGNSKLGEIKSVSLPSGLTCINCGCNKKCYAKKIERLRPNVRNSYIRNLNILEEDPQTYWREVEAAIMTSRFFRFHVSGDIADEDAVAPEERYLVYFARFAFDQLSGWEPETNLVPLIFNKWKNKQ